MLNIAKMTVMWSAASFSSYLLNFLNKYLEGSIYTNHYCEGISGSLAIIAGAQIYAKVGMKKSYILAYCIVSFCGITMFLLENGNIQMSDSILMHF